MRSSLNGLTLAHWLLSVTKRSMSFYTSRASGGHSTTPLDSLSLFHYFRQRQYDSGFTAWRSSLTC